MMAQGTHGLGWLALVAATALSQVVPVEAGPANEEGASPQIFVTNVSDPEYADAYRSGEPEVAIDSRDSNVLLMVFARRDFTYLHHNETSARNNCGYARSTDGGQTWSRADSMPLPGIVIDGAAAANCIDPMVASGPDGTFYMGGLAFADPRRGTVAIIRSTDGGVTWSVPSVAISSDDIDSMRARGLQPGAARATQPKPGRSTVVTSRPVHWEDLRVQLWDSSALHCCLA